MTPNDVLEFWFEEESRKRWFQSTPAFDQLIRDRFETTWEQAGRGELSDWENTAKGAVALAIVLDQFPLNMYRGEAKSFSTEAAARDVSERAIERGFDTELDDASKSFLYLPWMHSESHADQERSVQLYKAAGMDTRWAIHHQEIIAKFGRFPHRNGILSRENSAEETAYLNSDEAFTG